MRSGVEEEEDGKVRERIAGCEMNGRARAGERRGEGEEKIEEEEEGGLRK